MNYLLNFFEIILKSNLSETAKLILILTILIGIYRIIKNLKDNRVYKT